MPDPGLIFAVLAGVLLVVVIFGRMVLAIRHRRRIAELQSSRPVARSTGRTSTSSHAAIPQSRSGVTQFVKEHYGEIRSCKKKLGRKPGWLDALYDAIATYGVETRRLSVGEKFAVLYLINRRFKRHASARAEDLKNYLARTIVVYHKHEVRITMGRGKYVGCFEICYDVWCTHVPQAILERGALERPGLASAREALTGSSGTGYSRSSGRDDPELEEAMQRFVDTVLRSQGGKRPLR